MCYDLLLALGGIVVQVSSVEASQHKQRLYNSDFFYESRLVSVAANVSVKASASAAAAAITSFLLYQLNLFMLYSHPQPQPAQIQAASLA